MKKLKLTLAAGALLLFAACEGNVETEERIPACKNLTDHTACNDCCTSEGYDEGFYNVNGCLSSESSV